MQKNSEDEGVSLETVVDELSTIERETREMFQEVMNAHLDGTLPDQERSRIMEDARKFLEVIEDLFSLEFPLTLEKFPLYERLYKLITQIRVYLRKLSNKDLR